MHVLHTNNLYSMLLRVDFRICCLHSGHLCEFHPVDLECVMVLTTILYVLEIRPIQYMLTTIFQCR